MSDDVVCILSSGDETKESKSSKPTKRKSSSSMAKNCKVKVIDVEETTIVDSGRNDNDGGVEEFESPKPETSKIQEKKRVEIKPVLIVKDKVSIPCASIDRFEEFLHECANNEKADNDTKKILLKLNAKYKKLKDSDRNGEDLRLFLDGCLFKLNQGKFLNTLLELKDKLDKYIKQNEMESKGDRGVILLSDSELKKIKLLEDAIEKCKLKIKQLEEAEVDFDEDQNSAYLKLDLYKHRLIRLFHELAKLTKDKEIKAKLSEKKIKKFDIKKPMTGMQCIDDAIVNLINKKIKGLNKMKNLEKPVISDFLKLPDSSEVFEIIREKNETHRLGLSESTIETKAKSAHEAVVESLKMLRERDFGNSMESLLSSKEKDPADENPRLKTMLEKNYKKAKESLDAVFSHFTAKQKEDEKTKTSETRIKEDVNSNELPEKESEVIILN